jgi:hypothetical protein
MGSDYMGKLLDAFIKNIKDLIIKLEVYQKSDNGWGVGELWMKGNVSDDSLFSLSKIVILSLLLNDCELMERNISPNHHHHLFHHP